MDYGYRSRFRAAILACLLLLTLHPFPVASAKQPPFFEPKEGYYKAKAFYSVQVKWDVPTTTVVEGRDLNATLVISGAVNPTEIEKPDLKKVRAFDLFEVIDVSDPPRTPQDKEVHFNYKLRPRNRTVTQVPWLDFRFFSLGAPPGKDPYRFTRADSVPITVTEPPPKPVVPMTEADHLFHITTGPDVLRSSFTPCKWAWMAATLFGPLVATAWYLVWRRIFPDPARMAMLRRSRAARRATDTIRKANRTPDPPVTISVAVLSYLRTRFPLPESAVTPSEIAVALVEAKVAPEMAEQIADVFRDCDRARFAPPSDSGVSLAEHAEAAITRLEAIE